LSGHLERFWPDVQNSTWIYPENRWEETYSDRGGNMPYWLNGLVPLVYMGLDDAEEAGSLGDGYNLTAVVLARLQTLVGNQQHAAPGLLNHSMYNMFNLGTWYGSTLTRLYQYSLCMLSAGTWSARY
jgi:hypothetical protein